MKYLLTIFLILGMVSMTIGANDATSIDPSQTASNINIKTTHPDRIPIRDDIDVFSDDFENGIGDWETRDLTNPDTAWHKSDFLADEDDLVWWCGDTLTQFDEEPVGYDNSWLQFLDTPVLDLSNAGDGLTLTFTAYWLIEDPRRVPPSNPFDAWDGWLVMLSENGGEDFEAILPESPRYHRNRISAAENWFDLGPIPGWVFMSGEWDAVNDTTPEPEWVDVEFDLSDYAGDDDIVIRFLLVSDRAVAAPWNYYLRNSGVLIDDIIIQDEDDSVFLFNNADDDPIPEGEDLIPRRGEGFGDHWELTDADKHSGDWSMWNTAQNFSVTNVLDTPPFEVPEDFNTFFQFWVYCDLEDWDSNNDGQLDDFYQVFVSDNDGESWQYQLHDYKRDAAGGEEWTHYIPGTPFGDAANIDMDLSEWAGESIQLRWMFRTDHDHGDGNDIGDGLFIDDIEVIGVNRQPRDAGMTDMILPFPLAVNHRTEGFTSIAHNYGTRALDNIWAKWGWDASNGGRNYPIIPRPSLDPEDFELIELTDFADRNVPGWTPTVPGVYPVWARTIVGANTPANPNDDDQVPSNDSTGIGVVVWPEGIFELGYDMRTVNHGYIFESGEGPAARFTTDDIGQDHGVLGGVRLMFNGLDEAMSFTLHILDEGPNIRTPGDEFDNYEIEVPPEATYPNWLTIPLWDQEAICLEGDFWVWVELGQDTLPMIVGDDMVAGEMRFFNFNGDTMTDFQADLMMHAIVVPEAIHEKTLTASTLLVDFDEVPLGQGGLREVRLYSTAFETVTITNVYTESEHFEVDWPGETALGFAEHVAFDILFVPPDLGFHQGVLVIEADAEAVPRIDLAGSGAHDVPEDEAVQPAEFKLASPYPNPFNNTTRIDFSLDRPDQAVIALFDLAGRQVMTMANSEYTAGAHHIILKADNLPAGIYLIRLEAAERTAVKKVVLMK